MDIQLDRQLPVPIPIQVQGQIEYGMVNGDFPPGSRLPSVRDLAATLGVSPVTVSEAYRNLAERGLIESVRGRGTFVRAAQRTRERGTDPHRLEADVAHLIRRAEHLGVGRGAVLDMVHRSLASADDGGVPLRMVLVGVHPAATRTYATSLRRWLRHDDRITTVTIDALHEQPALIDTVRNSDLVLTFAHRERELTGLVPSARVATLELVASKQTRIDLATIDSRARVALIAVAGFLPTFRRSVARFASHLEDVTSLVAHEPSAPASFTDIDVLVYGTGCEYVLDHLPGGVRAFEYRHAPDPTHVETVLLPLFARLRRRARLPAPAP